MIYERILEFLKSKKKILAATYNNDRYNYPSGFYYYSSRAHCDTNRIYQILIYQISY